MWVCPNGCDIDKGLVCGGDGPYRRRGISPPGNIYFYMDLETEEYLHEAEFYEFPLDDEDWEQMFDHADGGCCGEPQCPECFEYLEEQ